MVGRASNIPMRNPNRPRSECGSWLEHHENCQTTNANQNLTIHDTAIDFIT